MVVFAVDKYKSNAGLIGACWQLDYLTNDLTLDATYGYGTFWKIHPPANLITLDLYSDAAIRGDFTSLPFRNQQFHNVVYDPPYKLNGTPDPDLDKRYGTHYTTSWQARMQLIVDGFKECARVLGDGHLLAKCQDQVCSGKVRWQTHTLHYWADYLGLELVDRLDMLSYRPQPSGTRQVHARRNTSTLMVFKRC